MLTRVAAVVIAGSLWSPLAVRAADIEFREPRPLAKLVGNLVEVSGYLVTYEEAPYDEANELHTDSYANGTKFRSPTWATIKFQVPSRTGVAGIAASSPEPRNTAGPLQMIRGFVAQYNASGNPGRFKTISDGEYIHIVPAGRMLNKSLEAFQPILDTGIAMPPEPKLCLTVLEDLLGQVGRLRSTTIVEGMVPLNPLLHYQCNVVGENLTAREALIQILEKMGHATGNYDLNRWTWNLVYDANINGYFLNTWLVPRVAIASQPIGTVEPVEPASVPSLPKERPSMIAPDGSRVHDPAAK